MHIINNITEGLIQLELLIIYTDNETYKKWVSFRDLRLKIMIHLKSISKHYKDRKRQLYSFRHI